MRLLLSIFLAAACDLALVGCASAPPRSPSAGLPSYDAEDAALLDDSFSGHLFETAFVPGVAGDDSRFADRVRAADSILLVKVATVSKEGSLAARRRYDLSFRTLESIVGAAPVGPIALTISPNDPSFHWLDRVGGAWVGRELLLMLRRYRAGDQVTLHFHGEPNTPELRARISEIRSRSAAAQRAARATKK